MHFLLHEIFANLIFVYIAACFLLACLDWAAFLRSLPPPIRGNNSKSVLVCERVGETNLLFCLTQMNFLFVCVASYGRVYTTDPYHALAPAAAAYGVGAMVRKVTQALHYKYNTGYLGAGSTC